MVKSLQDERLVQCLMVFNDIYSAVRSTILMMSLLPNVNHAYTLLIQDEKQREAYINPNFPGNSPSFLVAQQHSSTQRFQPIDFKGKTNNLVCSHCRKPDHSVDKCYRIIIFPSDFKFTKTGKVQGGVRSNAVITVAPTTVQAPYANQGGSSLSQDRFSLLIQLLQNVQIKIGRAHV